MVIGFFYLVAVVDWYPKRILAWRLSDAMDNAFCIDALEEVIERSGAPDFSTLSRGANSPEKTVRGF